MKDLKTKLKVGENYEYRDKVLECKESNSKCDGCYFFQKDIDCYDFICCINEFDENKGMILVEKIKN